MYIELKSRNDNRQVTVRFNEEPVQDHQSQRKHTTGNIEKVFEMMLHIIILLSGFCISEFGKSPCLEGK